MIRWTEGTHGCCTNGLYVWGILLLLLTSSFVFPNLTGKVSGQKTPEFEIFISGNDPVFLEGDMIEDKSEGLTQFTINNTSDSNLTIRWTCENIDGIDLFPNEGTITVGPQSSITANIPVQLNVSNANDTRRDYSIEVKAYLTHVNGVRPNCTILRSTFFLLFQNIDNFVSHYGSYSGNGSYENPFNSIQIAIDLVPEQSSILVLGSSENATNVYYENIHVNKSLNLVGSSVVPPIIDGRQYDAVTIATNGVNMSGFIVKNGRNGISLSARFAIIENNSCEFNSGNGIRLSDCSDITLRNNNCSYNGNDGIQILYSHDIDVIENNCSYNKQYGIYFRYSNENEKDDSNNALINNNVTGQSQGVKEVVDFDLKEFLLSQHFGIPYLIPLITVILIGMISSRMRNRKRGKLI